MTYKQRRSVTRQRGTICSLTQASFKQQPWHSATSPLFRQKPVSPALPHPSRHKSSTPPPPSRPGLPLKLTFAPGHSRTSDRSRLPAPAGEGPPRHNPELSSVPIRPTKPGPVSAGKSAVPTGGTGSGKAAGRRAADGGSGGGGGVGPWQPVGFSREDQYLAGCEASHLALDPAAKRASSELTVKLTALSSAPWSHTRQGVHSGNRSPRLSF